MLINMNTPVKGAKSTVLGKCVTQAEVLLNTKKDLFHQKGTIGYWNNVYVCFFFLISM